MLHWEIRLQKVYSLTQYIDFTKAFCAFRVLYSFSLHA